MKRRGGRRLWSTQAERARDRIEEAFRESTLPSLLVVWRGDEPRSPLADAIECLAKRIASAREA